MIKVWTKNLREIKVYVITVVDQKNLEKATIFINNKGNALISMDSELGYIIISDDF